MYICMLFYRYLQYIVFFYESERVFFMFIEAFEQFKKAIFSFDSISDFLDIILVAFVIFSIISLIKETRAIQLAKGLIILVCIYALVSLADMEVSKFILNFIFNNLFIIIVIIFAPELRHILERVGKSSVSKINLFNLKNKIDFEKQEDTINSINGVCKACVDMSDKKIGALIVFEKDSLLGEITKTGTTLDAKVTTELIENIFFPKAPMHDGAIVIKDGRVTAAGCILPLTSKDDLSSELGTRHRAAIGMSETSDAIIAIVSEETGAISIAENGKLMRDVSDGVLREVLMTNFVKTSNKEDSKFKKILRGGKDEE